MWGYSLKLYFSSIYIFIVQFPLYKAEDCSEILCSNINDHVCGIAEKNGIKIIETFQNICKLNQIRCRLSGVMDIYQVPDELCNITKRASPSGRREAVPDFSIVGAHQACNHTCPTYCVDTYEPACAQIWTSPSRYKHRPMINHCHIDMLSCASGVNVTVEPLGKCYLNPSGLLFMMQVAGLKTLRLLDDTAQYKASKKQISRRFNQAKMRRTQFLKKLLNPE